ncbi:50S ribosomal protein L13 [bacterium (Candidatus Gribaldobacteria) CG08_land_8_20_14_0_20_39_15]|uniref:Large ribosomal subunit protein uL13 n=1 Tax=bacterium (Candidatus Gribaldobacteria) CG08_land_8_20_14_0_20_39_15 TaxID=2014273 RepID=A0A2M6XV23_9BACT|nr:MAG: 50S ribosomal protein L13 [bacterium (Candidatus Gribaldobacteria) CG08_land_8_20_14_0_20_39_15]
MKKTYTIDATGKSLGRLASDVANILRGKLKTDFVPYKDGGDFVVLKNAAKVKISGNKLQTKVYHRYTGYIGSMKSTTMAEMIAKKGIQEVIRRAVWGMLPTNKLRDQMIKRLKVNP